jgi:hypothetical protein
LTVPGSSRLMTVVVGNVLAAAAAAVAAAVAAGRAKVPQ